VRFSADLAVVEVFESVECELVLMDLKDPMVPKQVPKVMTRIVSDLTLEREA
jgi:hypothetical protein